VRVTTRRIAAFILEENSERERERKREGGREGKGKCVPAPREGFDSTEDTREDHPFDPLRDPGNRDQ